MSKIFYDHLFQLDHLAIFFATLDTHKEEKEELWHLIDEMLHHRILTAVLDKLPGIHHKEFLTKFAENPAVHNLIAYINNLIEEDIEGSIIGEIASFEQEIQALIQTV